MVGCDSAGPSVRDQRPDVGRATATGVGAVLDVLTCGLVTLDLVQEVEEFPPPDTKITARSARLDVGGPATNAARTATVLGSETGLVTLVGTGPVADVIRARLDRTAMSVVDATPPGAGWSPPVSAATVDASGRRVVVSTNAGGAPGPALDLRSLPGARVVLVDGHHLAVAGPLVRRAKEQGTLVLLDGGSWKPGLEQLLPHVDVAILSADFVVPEQWSRLLASRPVVATSHGPAPIEVRIGDASFEVPVPEVAVVDTLGAGDVLHGAFAHFVAAAAERITPDVVVPALRSAAGVASQACSRRGLPW